MLGASFGGRSRHGKVHIESGFGAHSSPYDCRSPSGNTPLGNRSATGTVGGLVCSNAFFLPALARSFSDAWREGHRTGLSKVIQHTCLCWPSSCQCPQQQREQQQPQQRARFLQPPRGRHCSPARRQAARPHRLRADLCQLFWSCSAQGVCCERSSACVALHLVAWLAPCPSPRRPSSALPQPSFSASSFATLTTRQLPRCPQCPAPNRNHDTAAGKSTEYTLAETQGKTNTALTAGRAPHLLFLLLDKFRLVRLCFLCHIQDAKYHEGLIATGFWTRHSLAGAKLPG